MNYFAFGISIRFAASRAIFSLTFACFSFTSVIPTSTSTAQTSPDRIQSITYPLDAVQFRDTTYIVDRNLPGIWRHEEKGLSVFVQGDKRYRHAMNAPRCIAVSGDGTLYVGDSATREIYEINQSGETKPLTNGLIGIPVDLALDRDGILYVADLERRGIWKWNPTKNETPECVYPKANARGIAIDSQNRLWVLSQNAQQLVRYDESDKPVVIVQERVFEFGHNVLVDEDGTAWVSDGYAKAVWKVTEGTAPIKAITSELFQNPVGLFKLDDKIAIVDPHASTVFQASRAGAVEILFKVDTPPASQQEN